MWRCANLERAVHAAKAFLDIGLGQPGQFEPAASRDGLCAKSTFFFLFAPFIKGSR
jgi:hypothetical protein